MPYLFVIRLKFIFFLPRYEELWNVLSEGIGHLTVADVGDALKREGDVNRVAAREVILDRLDDKLHEVTAPTDQHRYEEIALVSASVKCIYHILVIVIFVKCIK